MKNITQEELLTFQKRWRELMRQQSELDYKKSQLARQLRLKFDSGVAGDRAFVTWCADNLPNMSQEQARGLLCLAQLAPHVTNQADLKSLVGSNVEARLPTVTYKLNSLTPKERVAVIEQAKVEKLTIPTIVNQRQAAQARVSGTPVTRDRSTSGPISNSNKAGMRDVEKLAQFIAANISELPHLPADVEVIVRMYVPTLHRAPAKRQAARA